MRVGAVALANSWRWRGISNNRRVGRWVKKTDNFWDTIGIWGKPGLLGPYTLLSP
jgi:hypothetical protein